MIVDYINAHKIDYGVEPIRRVLSRAGVQIAPSTYYAAKTRPPSARAVRDMELVEQIHRVHDENHAVYGARKVHVELNRQGIRVARCTVERLMRTEGLRGIARSKNPRTTIAAADTDMTADLVNRGFTASAPDQLWAADITYVRTFAGLTYAAFVIDVGVHPWTKSLGSLPTGRRLAVVDESAYRSRTRCAGDGHLDPRICRSGLIPVESAQYRAVRYTQRLADAGVVASVGSRGDSYDNALVKTFNSQFKAELIRNKDPWKSIDDLEIAVAEYIDWFNHRRLHGEIGIIPPVEAEQSYYESHTPVGTTERVIESLH